MLAVIRPTGQVPGLPPYEPEQSLSLAAACRLGLVPGHDGRRANPAEVRAWAKDGFPVGPLGSRYLFPAAWVGGAWRTTVPWCCAWVRFIADAQAQAAAPRTEPAAELGGRA